MEMNQGGNWGKVTSHAKPLLATASKAMAQAASEITVT